MAAVEIAICSDPQQVATTCLRRMRQLAEAAIASRGRCRIALSGGSTPRLLYEQLGQDDLPWSSIDLYWGDERVADKSNFEMVKAALLDRVDVGGVYPIPVELGGAAAAAKYSEILPDLDITLLGMGSDGHTASIFPGMAPSEERVIVSQSPKAPIERVSITLKTIRASQACLSLVTGESKAARLREIQDGAELPFAMVDSVWIVDEAAAAQLRKEQ